MSACPFSRAAAARARPAEDAPEEDQQHALNLRHLSEAVAYLTHPPNEDLQAALNALITSSEEDRLRFAPLEKLPKDVSRWQNYSYLEDIYDTLQKTNGTEAALEGVRLLGAQLAASAPGRVVVAWRALGGSLRDFLAQLDGVHDVLQEKARARAGFVFSQSQDGAHTLLVSCERPAAAFLLAGCLRAVADTLYGTPADVVVTRDPADCRRFRYTITPRRASVDQSEGAEVGEPQRLSESASALPLDVRSFCRAFPWHMVLDRQLQLTQVGAAFVRLLSAQLRSRGRALHHHFELRRPRGVQLRFADLVARANTPFLLAIKTEGPAEGLELKGQMVLCPESDSLLFVGSPYLDGLDGLTGKGLFISDIPLHDATRDVILVGEQARAQDGLRRRMDKLKSSIEEANLAVDKEREKNVSLLHLIFPPHIARRLWLGETIEATSHDDVTMLFSDIVGFTSICSGATPIMVINMLQSLYSQFDVFCGQLDVYKVETIGDAYCVAGGLHKQSDTHAQQIAWMALRMIETCANHVTHDGRPIRMRVGLHTGTVLAGVVGRMMPRYCLFGNNVTIANKFESGSEPLRVNVSPTTHRWLVQTPGFEFEERPRECLPKGFPKDIPGTCYFVLGYKHPSLPADRPLADHVEAAIAELGLQHR
ncbi:head-specific guanylate cyclase-like [Schistocerca piceifrons]|uniref:head-specific guanylate cyclase-like n=1 Tax=Schistocerca piceifrons TaxID=274613 RepID=UPI001F5E7FC5|nr:head-specific guanylate cyclase-like [Schistocerca piceifrons]